MVKVRKRTAEVMQQMKSEIDNFMAKYQAGEYDNVDVPINARTKNCLLRALQADSVDEFFHYVDLVGREKATLELFYGVQLYTED